MWICDPCGRKLGKHNGCRSTWHAGECGYCGQKQYVTEDRDYGLSKSDNDFPEFFKTLFQ